MERFALAAILLQGVIISILSSSHTDATLTGFPYNYHGFPYNYKQGDSWPPKPPTKQMTPMAPKKSMQSVSRMTPPASRMAPPMAAKAPAVMTKGNSLYPGRNPSKLPFWLKPGRRGYYVAKRKSTRKNARTITRYTPSAPMMGPGMMPYHTPLLPQPMAYLPPPPLPYQPLPYYQTSNYPYMERQYGMPYGGAMYGGARYGEAPYGEAGYGGDQYGGSSRIREQGYSYNYNRRHARSTESGYTA